MPGPSSFCVKPLNDPELGPGYMRITTALPKNNRRFVAMLREVLSCPE
jgi:histidinol-phosphate aminotransferase